MPVYVTPFELNRRMRLSPTNGDLSLVVWRRLIGINKFVPQGSPRTRAGVRAFVDDDLAVHHDILDTLGVAERFFVSRAVTDFLFVEEHNVGE